MLIHGLFFKNSKYVYLLWPIFLFNSRASAKHSFEIPWKVHIALISLAYQPTALASDWRNLNMINQGPLSEEFNDENIWLLLIWANKGGLISKRFAELNTLLQMHINTQSILAFTFIERNLGNNPPAAVAAAASCFSRVWLFVNLGTVTGEAPLSMGFSRQEYWSGLPCPPPGDFPHPGI